MIGVGIVGFGKIAQDQHLGAIEDSPRFFLHSVADHADVAVTVPLYPDVEAMLDAPDTPDAIAVCTPPLARYDVARKALKCRKHVLLEKPPCTTVEEAEALKELARNAGVSLFCAWHSRFAPAIHAAREWLSQRQVQRVCINWREDVRVWHPGQQWIWQAGGFGVFDAGINALSIATTILPGKFELRDTLLRIPEDCETPVSAELKLGHADGIAISASFDFSQTGPQTWEIEIQTDGGQMILLEGGARLLRDGQELPLGPDIEYPALYAHFAALIDANDSDVDLTPLQLVIDALQQGQREIVPALHLLFSPG